MTIRVIQWVTSPVGSVQLAEVIDNPGLELAGVFVYSPDKAGVDAGRLVGRRDTGVVSTNDKAVILSLDADVVLYSPSKPHGFDGDTDDIVALLESGKSVITATSYAHLPTLGAAVHERVKLACALGDSRFYAAAQHPGFMLEKLAVSLTALSQRVDKITVQQFMDCSHVRDEHVLIDLMGMGKRPDAIGIDSPIFRLVSKQAEQAIAATADALGAGIDEVAHVIRTAVLPTDLTVDCAILAAGSVVGQILSSTAYRGREEFVTIEQCLTCTSDIPGWDLALDGHTVRIRIDGVPAITAELHVGFDGIAEFTDVSIDYVAVGISAIRAIPYVLKEPAGVVIPEIFGAYRLPR